MITVIVYFALKNSIRMDIDFEMILKSQQEITQKIEIVAKKYNLDPFKNHIEYSDELQCCILTKRGYDFLFLDIMTNVFVKHELKNYFQEIKYINPVLSDQRAIFITDLYNKKYHINFEFLYLTEFHIEKFIEDLPDKIISGFKIKDFKSALIAREILKYWFEH